MKKPNIITLAAAAIGMAYLCLPSHSFGYETIHYRYAADGGVESSYKTVGANGKILEQTLYDSEDRVAQYTVLKNGADVVQTYNYNERTGTALMRTMQGKKFDETTFVNEHGQAEVSWDNTKKKAQWEIFTGGKGGKIAKLQAEAGREAYDAMIEAGVARKTGPGENFKSSSGLKFSVLFGKLVTQVFVYTNDGQTKEFTFGASKKDFSKTSKGHALYATSVEIKTSAKDKPIETINKMADIATYTTHKRFDPIINVTGLLEMDSNGNFSLTTADGTHSLEVGDPDLRKQLLELVGSKVNLTVDNVNGEFSLYAIDQR